MTTTPLNIEALVDLCIKHQRPILEYVGHNWNSLPIEEKRLAVDAGVARLTAEVAQKQAEELQKKLDAQATLDEFTSKFARNVFAGDARWVNCYAQTECYGGSEEGGWNYTCYTLVACFPLSQFQQYTPASLADISKGATTLLDAMGLEADTIRLEVLPAQSVTLSRPRYE